MRKYTEAQKKSAKKWDAENLDRISIALPKGMKVEIKAAAGEGGSVNGFIREAVEARLKGDTPKPTPTPTAGNAPETPQKAAGAILEGGAVSLPSGEEKRPQNATETETGRTPCTVDSKIYSYAINGAKVKGKTINQYLDEAVDLLNYETAKLLAAKADEPTAEEKAEFKLRMQHEQAQRRRETAPKDWRKNSDSTTPADPERGEARFLASFAPIQRKAEEANKKAAETGAEPEPEEPAEHAEPT